MSTHVRRRKAQNTGRDARRNQEQMVRFNVYLPRESYEALEELQTLAGKRSMAETIRSALHFYKIVHESIEDGKEVRLYDKETNMNERLVSF